MILAEKVYRILENKLPAAAVRYAFELWHRFPFEFQLSKSRQSKLGDYTYLPAENRYIITVNTDLNPYSFLITYVHEVAHRVTGDRYGHRVKPHGDEWKSTYKELLYPALTEDVFPPALLAVLYAHLASPGASSCSDPELMKALDQYSAGGPSLYLSDIRPGETFRFRKTVFVKESVMRTRALCREVKTGRQYYVPEVAPVERVDKFEV